MCGDTRLQSVLIVTVALVTTLFVGCALIAREPVPVGEAAPPGELVAVAPAEEELGPEEQEIAPAEGVVPAEEVALTEVDIDVLYTLAKEAYESEQYVEAYELYQALAERKNELSWWRLRVVDGKLAQLQEMLREEHELTAGKTEAAALVDEIARLVEQEEFNEALLRVEALREKGLEEYLAAEDKARLEESAVAIAQATGTAGVMSKEQRKKLAEEWFETGMDAYKLKDYANAKLHLDKAAGLDVSIGWWDNRSLRKAREKVNSTLFSLQERYSKGQRLYELGNYAEAKEELLAIKESGVKCGDEIDKGVERCLADMDVKTGQQRLEEAKEYQEAIPRLDEQLENALASQAQETQLATQVMAKWEGAVRSWEAGDFGKAKALLEETRESLGKVDVEKFPELQGKDEDISQRLAVVDGKIAAQKEVADLLAEVESLYLKDVVEAQERVLEAQNVALARGIPLSEQQRELCQRVLTQYEEVYTKQQAARRERYWSLVAESEGYVQSGEYQLAREVLRLVEQADDPGLSDEQRGVLSGRIAMVEERLKNQQRLLEAVDRMEQRARGLVEEGKPGEAVEELARAVSVIRNEGLPNSVLLRVLEQYEPLLSEVVPVRNQQRIADLKAQASQRLEMLRELKPYLKAVYYLDGGSPDLAKPYLEVVAADEEHFGPERVQWAQEQLQGIDAEIQSLESRELLYRHDQMAQVYQLQRELLEKVEARQEVDLGPWLDKIADAKLRVQIARLEQLLARGAYPTAAKVVSETFLDRASSELVEKGYKPLAGRVRTWENAGYLLGVADEALEVGRLSEAAEALGDVEDMREDVGALTEIHTRLKGALDAATAALAQEKGAPEREKAELARVHSDLAAARQREEAYAAYDSARAAYLTEEWEKASDSLFALRSRQGLYAFERAAADMMYEKCGGMVAPKDETIAGARELLDAAQDEFSAGLYVQASGRLQLLREMPGWNLDRQLAEQAMKLTEAIQDKEEEAEELYQEAVEASRSQDHDLLRELLARLRMDYRHTSTFRLHR